MARAQRRPLRFVNKLFLAYLPGFLLMSEPHPLSVNDYPPHLQERQYLGSHALFALTFLAFAYGIFLQCCGAGSGSENNIVSGSGFKHIVKRIMCPF
jgi:hypothetical protein